jgi:molybdopterin biosynthesis enzyme
MHENEAAEVLCSICRGENMRRGEVKEGKIELCSEIDGVLRINREKLMAVNSFGQMMIATRHGDFPVKKGDKLAGTRIIPLVIEKEKMERAKEAGGDAPLFRIAPFVLKKAAVLATGSEVFHGRIRDRFTPVIEEKLREYGVEVVFREVFDDVPETLAEGCLRAIDAGAQMVFCTGGMSVDPDDRTPLAIRNTGARIVTYGAPVLPGAMFLLSYLERNGREIPVMGLPGCVMYAGRTIVDLMLPRIAAKDPVTAEEIAALGEGGLCLNCKVCTWPNCGFGKGC